MPGWRGAFGHVYECRPSGRVDGFDENDLKKKNKNNNRKKTLNFNMYEYRFYIYRTLGTIDIRD